GPPRPCSSSPQQDLVPVSREHETRRDDDALEVGVQMEREVRELERGVLSEPKRAALDRPPEPNVFVRLWRHERMFAPRQWIRKKRGCSSRGSHTGSTRGGLEQTLSGDHDDETPFNSMGGAMTRRLCLLLGCAFAALVVTVASGAADGSVGVNCVTPL